MSDLAPRLVATDLDGTIVRTDGTISARTVAALARVERAGATLVLVTGRPPRWIHSVATAVDHRGHAICSNGALLYDLHTEQVLRAHLIDPEVLATVVTRLRDAVPGLAFAAEREEGLFFEDRYDLGFWDRDLRSYGGRCVHGPELTGRPAAKLLGLHSDPDIDPDSLSDQARKAVGDLVTVTHSSDRGLVEMSRYGVSKASALAEFCAERGIAPADVVAFGDMPNDLPMLSWVGRSYAVANAHPDVRAAVGRCVASNNDDGVAQMIEALPRPTPVIMHPFPLRTGGVA